MRILVVDDNIDILEGMKLGIRWKEIGMEEVFYADRASIARQIILQNKPDILLTDIEMPEENGLELWRWAKERYKDMKCIFLTSHAEFEYAQEAIRKGGFDYVLQPAKPQNIENVVLNCRNQIFKERKMRNLAEKGLAYEVISEKALERLATALFLEGKNFQGRMPEWNVEINPSGDNIEFYPCMFVFEDICPEKEMRCYLEKSIFKNGYVLCKPSDGILGIIFCCNQAITEKDILLFLTKTKQQIEYERKCETELYLGMKENKNLPQIVEDILRLRRDNVMKNKRIFKLDEKKIYPQIRKPETEKWKQWIQKGDGVLVWNQMNNLIRNANEEGILSLEYMSTLFWCFFNACSMACQEVNLQLTDLFDGYYTMEKFQTSYESVENFLQTVHFCLDSFEKKKNAGEEANLNSIEERIRFAEQYIENHLNEILLRDDMAARVYLNEDYFSRMFKRYTGKGYKEYVLGKKMEYACKLLEETMFPVSVVSVRVGYDYFSNFAQAFKKYTGLSPQEYRRQKTESSKQQ